MGGLNQPTAISLCEEMVKEQFFSAVSLREFLKCVSGHFEIKKFSAAAGGVRGEPPLKKSSL